jgi:hypothetical protein
MARGDGPEGSLGRVVVQLRAPVVGVQLRNDARALLTGVLQYGRLSLR